MTVGSTTYYYVYNLQGDIIAITNGGGFKVVEYTYDPWGKLISTTGSMASSIGVQNPYRYRAYRYDTELEMYYLNSRYYDPEIGRFINADGLVSTGQGILGYNMFAYCNNNSVNMVDNNGAATVKFQPNLFNGGATITGEATIETRYGEIKIVISMDVHIFEDWNWESDFLTLRTTSDGMELEFPDGTTISMGCDLIEDDMSVVFSAGLCGDKLDFVVNEDGLGAEMEVASADERISGTVSVSYKIEPVKIFFNSIDDVLNCIFSPLKGAMMGGGSPSEYAYINGGTLGLPTRNVTIF